MKAILMMLLEQIVKRLIGVDWNLLLQFVVDLWNDPMPNSEKRKIVMQRLVALGSPATEAIMKMAIEYAYQQVQTQRIKP